MHKYLITLFFIGATVFNASAQNRDTLVRKSHDNANRILDTDPTSHISPKRKKEKIYHPDSTHSPRKAWIRSALVPGWGQAYNRQWWKVPAIYAGLGLLANAVITNQKDYKIFLAVAKYQQLGIPYTDARYVNDPNLPNYQKYDIKSKDAIINAKDGAFRNKEISILSFVAVWTVNIVDAYIYGKLQHSYSMDNNFSMKVEPTSVTQPVYASNFNTTFTPGLKITITLK